MSPYLFQSVPANACRLTMDDNSGYTIRTDIMCNPLELIDIRSMHETCRIEWFNQSLCNVNDCVVRLGILHGEFHWHKHDAEDEFFYVVEGTLIIDLEHESYELNPQQGFMVPKGVRHRTRAPERTVILMIEGNTVTPTGD